MENLVTNEEISQEEMLCGVEPSPDGSWEVFSWSELNQITFVITTVSVWEVLL